MQFSLLLFSFFMPWSCTNWGNVYVYVFLFLPVCVVCVCVCVCVCVVPTYLYHRCAYIPASYVYTCKQYLIIRIHIRSTIHKYPTDFLEFLWYNCAKVKNRTRHSARWNHVLHVNTKNAGRCTYIWWASSFPRQWSVAAIKSFTLLFRLLQVRSCGFVECHWSYRPQHAQGPPSVSCFCVSSCVCAVRMVFK
jgi:hypothetical protein